MARRDGDFPDSWYAATADAPRRMPPLDGDTSAEVCVIGGGIAGLSAALHLAEDGVEVVLLEAERVAWGASGRSGGQCIFGYACDMPVIEQQVGDDSARQLFNLSLEALDLTRDRIQRHAIDCDLARGMMHVAIKPRQHRELLKWRDTLASRYGYTGLEMLEGEELRAEIQSPRYRSGLMDRNSFHLHPMNYTLGLARAARDAGVRIVESSRAQAWQAEGERVRVLTERGSVMASQLVLAANTGLGDLAPELAARIMPVGTYVAASRLLSDDEAASLLPGNAAISDINFVLDYFRLGREPEGQRLLFGGRVSYSTLKPVYLPAVMKRRVEQVFPQLGDPGLEYVWGGYVDITMNRAPDFGRLAPNVHYLQGFSGHGMALTGLAGKLVAESIRGRPERFDLYTRLRHRPFPGGRALRTPALALAMAWYRMRDWL